MRTNQYVLAFHHCFNPRKLTSNLINSLFRIIIKTNQNQSNKQHKYYTKNPKEFFCRRVNIVSTLNANNFYYIEVYSSHTTTTLFRFASGATKLKALSENGRRGLAGLAAVCEEEKLTVKKNYRWADCR